MSDTLQIIVGVGISVLALGILIWRAVASSKGKSSGCTGACSMCMNNKTCPTSNRAPSTTSSDSNSSNTGEA